jgi:hypothetical protein
MPSYLVERYLPSTAVVEVEAAVARLAADQGQSGGVRHLWTALIEVEETCLSLFEAASADAVEAANRAAQFPFDRIVEASLIQGGDP